MSNFVLTNVIDYRSKNKPKRDFAESLDIVSFFLKCCLTTQQHRQTVQPVRQRTACSKNKPNRLLTRTFNVKSFVYHKRYKPFCDRHRSILRVRRRQSLGQKEKRAGPLKCIYGRVYSFALPVPSYLPTPIKC